MKIAMDYDRTFTEDRWMFAAIIRMMKDRGHDVRFVTYRFERSLSRKNNDILQDAEALGIPVIFSNYTQKREVWNADIWVDDMPELIPTKDTMRDLVLGELPLSTLNIK